jgi:hypothetical protein
VFEYVGSARHQAAVCIKFGSSKPTIFPATTVLEIVVLFARANSSIREVETRKDVGVVEWIEVTEADGQGFTVTVGAKGQPGVPIANSSSTQSVVGASIGRIVKDGDARLFSMGGSDGGTWQEWSPLTLP